MAFSSPQGRTDEIADAIRKRICLQPIDEQTMLLEGTLAAEFGVSRTPVRQALQRLAYEGLIEVRSGVGSISNPLDPRARGMHIAVHCGLLRLVGTLPDAPVPPLVAGRLAWLAQETQRSRPMDEAMAFDLFSELNSTLSGLIPDPVMADAHLVSGWRIVRWFLDELRHEGSRPVEILHRACRSAQAEAGSGRAAVLLATADILELGAGEPQQEAGGNGRHDPGGAWTETL